MAKRLTLQSYDLNPVADNGSARMYWECLRRNERYHRFHEEYQKVLAPATKHKQGALLLSSPQDFYPKFLRLLKKHRFPFDVLIADPSLSFDDLPPEATHVTGGFKELKIESKDIGPDLWKQLHLHISKQGYKLPRYFTLTITPANPSLKLPTGKSMKLRKRADIKQFQAEMLAWDLRKAGQSWANIARKLPILKDVSTRQTPETALIMKARNYFAAAQKKINCCLDWRGVK